MTGTAPCYGCGKNPTGVVHVKNGEQPLVCVVCRFGICFDCGDIMQDHRPCCKRALDEGWAETGDWWSPKGLVKYAARQG